MTDEHGPEEAERERSLNLRLDELDRKIELVLQAVCPVCGPALLKKIHPDIVQVLAENGNGKVHVE